MKLLRPEKSEGAGKTGCPWHPRSVHRKLHTVDHRYPETPGFPCAMALRLIPRSPRRRIRLVTVVGGLKVCQNPVGPTRLRQLDTSNGCQDHTALPYAATSAKTCRRTVCDPPGSARGISTSFVHAPVTAHEQNPPCDAVRARRCRVHRILFPRPWRSRYTPLSGTGQKRYTLIWDWSQELFLKNGS
jgi:hypothetical protein